MGELLGALGIERCRVPFEERDSGRLVLLPYPNDIPGTRFWVVWVFCESGGVGHPSSRGNGVINGPTRARNCTLGCCRQRRWGVRHPKFYITYFHCQWRNYWVVWQAFFSRVRFLKTYRYVFVIHSSLFILPPHKFEIEQKKTIIRLSAPIKILQTSPLRGLGTAICSSVYINNPTYS